MMGFPKGRQAGYMRDGSTCSEVVMFLDAEFKSVRTVDEAEVVIIGWANNPYGKGRWEMTRWILFRAKVTDDGIFFDKDASRVTPRLDGLGMKLEGLAVEDVKRNIARFGAKYVYQPRR